MTKHTPFINRRWPAFAGLAVLAMSLAAPAAHAQDSATPVYLTTTVNRTRVTSDGTMGGCGARLAHELRAETGANCADNWVTFSCDGTHGSRADAMRLFDSAQLAFVTGRRAVIFVDDTRKHNDYCLAYRVDVLPN